MAPMTDIGYRIRDDLMAEAEGCGESGDIECMESVLRRARKELARDPDLLFDVETAVETYFPELTSREKNPIEGMPGGSVSGCIKLVSKRKDIDDPGAYCAAIADRIEPGWRERNPKDQLGLFGEKQAEVEGFALVPLEGKPVQRVRPPKEEQERLLPAEKPSREVMEKLRKRELEERAARRKRRKKTPLDVIKRRLLR